MQHDGVDLGAARKPAADVEAKVHPQSSVVRVHLPRAWMQVTPASTRLTFCPKKAPQKTGSASWKPASVSHPMRKHQASGGPAKDAGSSSFAIPFMAMTPEVSSPGRFSRLKLKLSTNEPVASPQAWMKAVPTAAMHAPRVVPERAGDGLEVGTTPGAGEPEGR